MLVQPSRLEREQGRSRLTRSWPVQARGEARRGAAARRGAREPGGLQQAPFRAAPAPPTTRAPAPAPAPPERAPTQPAPFRLRSEARHEQARIRSHALAQPVLLSMWTHVHTR